MLGSSVSSMRPNCFSRSRKMTGSSTLWSCIRTGLRTEELSAGLFWSFPSYVSQPGSTVATSLAKVDTIKKCYAILCIHMCPELQTDSPRRFNWRSWERVAAERGRRETLRRKRSRIERLKAVDEQQYNSIGNGQDNSGRIVNTEAWSRSKLSRTSDGQADEIGGPIVHG